MQTLAPAISTLLVICFLAYCYCAKSGNNDENAPQP